MKKSFITAASLFLCIANAEASLGPTAEIKVEGELSAPTCTVNAPDGGVYDLGNIASSLIQQKKTISLPDMTKTWTVTCDADTYLNFTTIDNRGGSGLYFLFAKSPDGLDLGWYTVEMANGTVDGVPSGVFATIDKNVKSPQNKTFVDTSKQMGWADYSTYAQSAGRIFSVDLTIMTRLNSIEAMGGVLTDATTLDGSMTMNFAYGL